MIAAANGIDPDELSAILPHPEMAWDQAVWSGAQDLLLASLSPRDRIAICNDPGIKRIAFVRHPVERLWSAWVSKILVGEPRYADLRDELLGPFGEVILDAETSRMDLATLFGEFIERLPQLDIFETDIHFMPQSSLLGKAPADTAFYESADLIQRLQQYAPSLLGVHSLRRRNETRQLVDGPILTEGTFAPLLSLYEQDFVVFGARFSWGYESRWKVTIDSPQGPVNQQFQDRCRGARRLTNIVRQQAEDRRNLGSLQDTCARLAEELESLQDQHREITHSRIWRWTTGYRALRSWNK